MAGAKFSLDVEFDPLNGPLFAMMANYNRDEFENYVENRVSESNRYKYVREWISDLSVMESLLAQYQGKFDHRSQDIRDAVRSYHRDKRDVFGEHALLGSQEMHSDFSEMLRDASRAYLSGPEFAELAQATLTALAPVAGGTVAVAFVRSVEKIILKLLENRAAQKIKISLGGGRSIEVTGPIDEAKVMKLRDWLIDALKANEKPKG